MLWDYLLPEDEEECEENMFRMANKLQDLPSVDETLNSIEDMSKKLSFNNEIEYPSFSVGKKPKAQRRRSHKMSLRKSTTKQRQSTIPKPFNFSTNKRAIMKERGESYFYPNKRIHILKKNTANVPPLTVPESPIFATKNRRKRRIRQGNESSILEKTTTTTPNNNRNRILQPAWPLTSPHTPAFHLKSRDHSSRCISHNTNIIKEEKQHISGSIPLSLYHPEIPKKHNHIRSLTIPKPFHLESEALHQKAVEEFELKVQQEKLNENIKYKKKSKCIQSRSESRPLVIHHSQKKLTMIEPFEFATESRNTRDRNISRKKSTSQYQTRIGNKKNQNKKHITIPVTPNFHTDNRLRSRQRKQRKTEA